MRRRGMVLLLLLCLLGGCEGKVAEEAVSCVGAEDCILCGWRENGGWGEDNVGIVSLNTFEIMAVEINGYDREGARIEENTGTGRVGSFQSGEKGFSACGIEDPDRGYAVLRVKLGEDGAMNREKAAGCLCEDCLEEMKGKEMGLGMVDLCTGEVRALERESLGFGMGDFYIHCDWEDGGEEVGILIFYCPLRYGI